ncbi:spore germination protein (amino acid permease) [Paenibacillus cellulosilyticus]|uniref:Spore germination protein (Amino acid permease) n=1 Tax=Paenibacillus cellulosilyticus TaxID=375489 RepID=A0A2V2YTB8_9BACL|nr:endospore germination permease [Paenibacillus cellulosilyticus]PWW01261.1 spore germination protein (amino acid permease) [Paenibacillus cellulosilyticus]QKS46792.1 endospore germination permease [Paenibacillus cellulosilyticus]
MVADRGKITVWLSYSILLLSAGLVCHVLSIPAILDTAGRDGWLSILAAAPLFLLFILMMYYILRTLQGQRMLDWLESQLGAFPAWVIRISASMLLFILGAHTLYETSFWTVSTYLQFTPILAIVSLGAFVPMIAACRGIRSIAITSSIILPFVLMFGYFVMAANSRYKDYSRLMPMMENGMGPVLHGMIYSLAGLTEIWILVFIQHQVNTPFKLWHLLVLAIFMIFMALGPTMSAITVFGPEEAMKQNSPPFEQWRIVNIGKLLQHVDFLSIYQWLCGSFGRISISMYLIVELLEIRKPHARYTSLLIIAVCMATIAMYWWRSDLVYQYMIHIQFPTMLIYVYSLISGLAFLAFIKRNNKE